MARIRALHTRGLTRTILCLDKFPSHCPLQHCFCNYSGWGTRPAQYSPARLCRVLRVIQHQSIFGQETGVWTQNTNGSILHSHGESRSGPSNNKWQYNICFPCTDLKSKPSKSWPSYSHDLNQDERIIKSSESLFSEHIKWNWHRRIQTASTWKRYA